MALNSNPNPTTLTPYIMDLSRHMALNELAKPQAAVEDSDDDDDYYYGRPQKKPETHEWVFLDEFNRERFRHDGDTIVPGAGTRWKHKKLSAAGGGDGAMDDEDDDEDDEEEDEEDEEWEDDDDDDDDDEDDDYRRARSLPVKKKNKVEKKLPSQPAITSNGSANASASASASASGSTALAEIKEDDEEELPWQVSGRLQFSL